MCGGVPAVQAADVAGGGRVQHGLHAAARHAPLSRQRAAAVARPARARLAARTLRARHPRRRGPLLSLGQAGYEGKSRRKGSHLDGVALVVPLDAALPLLLVAAAAGPAQQRLARHALVRAVVLARSS